jgi:hypothetical protein
MQYPTYKNKVYTDAYSKNNDRSNGFDDSINFDNHNRSNSYSKVDYSLHDNQNYVTSSISKSKQYL